MGWHSFVGLFIDIQQCKDLTLYTVVLNKLFVCLFKVMGVF